MCPFRSSLLSFKSFTILRSVFNSCSALAFSASTSCFCFSTTSSTADNSCTCAFKSSFNFSSELFSVCSSLTNSLLFSNSTASFALLAYTHDTHHRTVGMRYMGRGLLQNFDYLFGARNTAQCQGGGVTNLICSS